MTIICKQLIIKKIIYLNFTKSKNALLLLITIFAISHATQAQTIIINQNCKTAYANILSLKLDDAQQALNNEKLANPQNVFVPYLENYIDFLKVIISEDQDLFNYYKNKVNSRIDIIEKLSDTSQYKNYLIGNVNLQWAIARAKFGEYATAAFQINKSYRLLNANNDKFPNFTPNLITLGILHIMIGVVPSSYQWILDLISMQGDVNQGQKELKNAYDACQKNKQYSFLQNEVLFYMGMINLSVNPDEQFAHYLLNKLNTADVNNLLLTYLAINTNMKIGNNSSALELFSTINHSANYYPFYYLNYLHGECLLRNLNTTAATEQLNIFLEKFTGKNYIKLAWQKIAWAYLINGDTLAYKKNMQNALIYGNTYVDGDKNANKAAETNSIPNVKLLKSQLLFDGGYYKKAKTILINIDDSLSVNQNVEITYRLGRIAQKTNNIDKAKQYYKTTIENGSSLKTYYAANSALLLGNIYELENDKTKAIYYYNVCINLKFEQYSNSIKGKAKIGLQRVE